MTRSFQQLNELCDWLLAQSPEHMRIAAPLGLGKPHRLLNAIYQRIVDDPQRQLHLMTALSLTPPSPSSDIEARFLNPFLKRHFGSFEPLQYAIDQRNKKLPDNVCIEEFYLQSGGLLNSADAQQNYASLNYTHVARAVASKQPRVIVQMVAREPNGSRLSLSCNPDLTFDLLDRMQQQGHPKPLLIAEIHPDLPFMPGAAIAPDGFFDAVLEIPGPAPTLFALPRQPVSLAEYAIGFYASTLVKDGGTLQIGIGALSDALSYALILRHTRNEEYRHVLRALWPGFETSTLVQQLGGVEPFQRGLYGASEMVMDGFMHLIRAGVIKRRVVDDLPAMQRIESDQATESDRALLDAQGTHLHGGFFLGSHELYQWLRELSDSDRRKIEMTRISHINELYGLNEDLERVQRQNARFFNTCMMATALGAAVSDALADERVVSGIGGQYNFVAMAHALHDARSVLMFRATRESGKSAASSVLWNYGHTSIPRHLRDIFINEYGIADLRDQTDTECVSRMLAITDARFAPALIAQAISALKLKTFDHTAWRNNTAEQLNQRLAPLRAKALLPDYPLGSDFDPTEQKLVRALGWLKQSMAKQKWSTLFAAISETLPEEQAAMQRMQFDKPNTFKEKLTAKLLRLALKRTETGSG